MARIVVPGRLGGKGPRRRCYVWLPYGQGGGRGRRPGGTPAVLPLDQAAAPAASIAGAATSPMRFRDAAPDHQPIELAAAQQFSLWRLRRQYLAVSWLAKAGHPRFSVAHARQRRGWPAFAGHDTGGKVLRPPQQKRTAGRCRNWWNGMQDGAKFPSCSVECRGAAGDGGATAPFLARWSRAQNATALLRLFCWTITHAYQRRTTCACRASAGSTPRASPLHAGRPVGKRTAVRQPSADSTGRGIAWRHLAGRLRRCGTGGRAKPGKRSCQGRLQCVTGPPRSGRTDFPGWSTGFWCKTKSRGCMMSRRPWR